MLLRVFSRNLIKSGFLVLDLGKFDDGPENEAIGLPSGRVQGES